MLPADFELRLDERNQIAVRDGAGGQGGQDAVGRVATQMQLFLASDVLYSQRFLPNLDRPLKKEGLLGQVAVPRTRFLPDLQWVRPITVARSLKGLGAATGPTGPIAPGLHGTALVGVTARPGGQQLSQSGATSITITAKLAFDVNVQNGGTNDERACGSNRALKQITSAYANMGTKPDMAILSGSGKEGETTCKAPVV